MNRLPLSFIIYGIFLFVTFSLCGCGSESGGTVDGNLVAQSYDESCSICHSSSLQGSPDVAVVHSLDSNSPQLSIIAVREVNVGAGDDRLEVDFKIFDSENPLIPLAVSSSSSVRFTLAKLDTSSGGSGSWQSYINSSETKDPGDPGTGPDGTYTQATSERGNAGSLSALATPGQYRYRFSFNMNTVTDPVSSAAITYNRAMTHLIAIQYTGNVDNAYMEFVPNSLPTPGAGATRDVVVNSTCNDCHIKLGFHGGDRIHIKYCVTCHNPGSADANSGETVDLGVMIHKIHQGESLPAVEAGGEYAIWGHGDSKNDYSTVVFPQDTRNCTRCHTGGSDSSNWMNYPTAAYCGSCHTAPNNSDTFTPVEIQEAHAITAQEEADNIQLNILDVSVSAIVSGARDITIDFSITNPNNSNAAYDITDTATVDLSGLSFLIGWDTDDFTNRDGGSTPAQPLRVGITDATDTGGYIYSLTVGGAIPAEVTGSGMVALQGRARMDLDNDGSVDDNVPPTSVTMSFAITDTVAQDRRSIVDINKCNECHGYLSLHGGNRNNDIQVCVICHNADATDISQRPLDPASTADGKVEESIDFKYMVHAIHAGQSGTGLHGYRENGIVVYGHGGSEHVYSHVRMPAGADNLKNCAGCHRSGTFELPISGNALPVTVRTGNDLTDPDDDNNITPITAACSSCHDSISAKSHMAENGGVFDFKAFAASTGSSEQAALCAPGPDSSMPAGHVERADCCSCHSPR